MNKKRTAAENMSVSDFLKIGDYNGKVTS